MDRDKNDVIYTYAVMWLQPLLETMEFLLWLMDFTMEEPAEWHHVHGKYS